MTTIDSDGKTIKINGDNLVRVDGIGVFRTVWHGDVLYLQFVDTDRYRATCRGSKFVEVPLHILVEKINQSLNQKDETK
jgi:hypothetical protein